MADNIAMSAQAIIDGQDPDEGWGFFMHRHDPGLSEKKQKIADEKNKRLAMLAAAMWAGDPYFRELVDFIFEQTLRRQVWTAQLGLPMDQAYGYGAFREGQNAVAEMIARMIKVGQSGIAAGAGHANTIVES